VVGVIGDVLIQNNCVFRSCLIDVSSMQNVDGNFQILDNPMASGYNLDALAYIAGSLNVMNNPLASGGSSSCSLAYTGSTATFKNTALNSNFAIIPPSETTFSSPLLIISGVPTLVNFNLQSGSALGTSILIENNVALQSIIAYNYYPIDNSGSITIQNNPQLTNVVFNEMNQINSLTYKNNPRLTTLGVPNLQTIAGTFTIMGPIALTAGVFDTSNGLGNLLELDGNFVIENTTLVDLSMETMVRLLTFQVILSSRIIYNLYQLKRPLLVWLTICV